jgi:hypothetical protein
MNSQLSYALSPGAALAELRFERSISSEASVKTEGSRSRQPKATLAGEGLHRCDASRDPVVAKRDGLRNSKAAKRDGSLPHCRSTVHAY